MNTVSDRVVMRRIDYLSLTAILAVAIVLRSIKLGTALWYDEIATLVEFVRLPTMDLITTLSSFNNHVLYSLEAQAAIAVFGESAWSLRLPAMLFGAASVGALWWFARQFVSAPEANMSALLLAVSYHHIWFSQNARGYTGIMFWAIVGTGLFMRGLNKASWSTWIAYGCTFAAAVYTHLSAGFFFGTHGLIYLVLMGRRAFHSKMPVETSNYNYAALSTSKPLFGFMLGGALGLLVHAPMLPQIVFAVQRVSAPVSIRAGELPVPEWSNPLWTVLEVVRNLQGLGLVASLSLPAALTLSAIGLFSLSRRRPILAVVLLAHIPVTLFCLWFLSFRIWPRYFFLDLGFIVFCIVHGVFVVSSFLARSSNVFERWSLKPKTLGVIASTLAIFCSLFLLPRNYLYPKQDFLGAREFVEAARAPEDTVASIGLASLAFSRYYAPDWNVVESWLDIERIRNSSSNTWLVYTSSAHMAQNYPDVLKGLEVEFELIKRFPGTLGDGTVFVYRSQP